MIERAAADAFGRLSPALQYQIANSLGWPDLRPVQQLATHAILDGANCVVLAPTAGGKTEAALLPLLSQMEREDWPGISVLYLAPIRALLNNQEVRLERLTGLVGRRSAKWHGDVSDSARRRILAQLPDVLAITPESLEAMLLSTRRPPHKLLGNVRAVVVDEIHAFAGDDRGAHLVALLERVSRISNQDIQRVGLSATVGDPEVILDWISGSSLRPKQIVNPGGARTQPKLAVDHVGSLENAALMIDRLHPGTRRLVFVDSRRRVEELGHKLAQRGVETFLSHSSLALSERVAAEKAFEEGSNCVIVATSALELGIDVGDLDHVIQIDAPGTVSSFLQRMGRTGRREGAVPNCTFLATDEEAVVQSCALLELFEQGYVEPSGPSSWAPHVLAHQAIALAMQERGVPAASWWEWVEGCAAFSEISPAERFALIRHMLASEILVEIDARLVLGPRGERLYGARNFLELYAVFSSPRVLKVLHGQQEVGVVDAFFLQDREREVANFVLGGRPWHVLGVDWRGGTCAVEPAREGAYPRWFGRPVLLSRALCQAIRDVLTGDFVRESWSKRAAEVIAGQRAAHTFLSDGGAPLIAEHDGRLRWWTHVGGAGNRVLTRMLEGALGERVTAGNLNVVISGDAARSEVAVRQAIDALAKRAPLNWGEVVRFADPSGSRISKFQPCLPPSLEQGLVAREELSPVDANAALAAWAR